MGKEEKIKNKRRFQHNPLDLDILDARYATSSSREKFRSNRTEDDQFVGGKLTSEILKEAQQQQKDLEEEIAESEPVALSLDLSSDAEDSEEILLKQSDRDLEELVTANINEDDERALENFMSKVPEHRITLADIIKEKLTEKQSEIGTIYSDAGSVSNYQLVDEKILSRFRALVPVLKEYRSGRLPKAFKAIPKFTNWDIILYATEPDKWSAATMYQATRMFASNLQDKMAQRFYNLFLLPRLRDDIAECKTLNRHLYEALKKALYKPAAFFKGIIIPLVKSGCTLREATIFGSVMAKCSIPVLHSSAALLTIAESDYTGVNSVFMRILLEKKYALPYRVINAVVDHFLKFMEDSREFPLLWHQCLLTFVQIYKIDISAEQKKNLLKLISRHHHDKVSPEIQKILEEKIDMAEAVLHAFRV